MRRVRTQRVELGRSRGWLGSGSLGYTLTWPYYCGNLFPCHPDPADGTRFSLSITGSNVSHSGVYQSRIENDAPAYMLAWIEGDYSRVYLGSTTAKTEVDIRYLPTGEAAARQGTQHLIAAFDWFERKLGPYRFGRTVGPVAVDWGRARYGGMQHHPFWHVDVESMSDEATQARAAAHGWFGNGVRLRCWEDLVMSEGTASYLAARVLEEVAGTTVSDPIWNGYESELTTQGVAGNRAIWPQSCGDVDVRDGLSSPLTSAKGALFYRSLEQRIGRENLDLVLSTFYQRFAGKAAGMQDVLDVVSELTSYDANACAKSWLIDLAIPSSGPCP